MKKITRLPRAIDFVLFGALLGGLSACTTYVQEPPRRDVYVPAPPVYAPPPQVVYTPPAPVVAPAPVEIVIRSENDFYEPLTPYGRWEIVGSYGRCWIPARVETNWRPYSNGYWQRTEAGWYWASDEPWGWATYHYGRWDFNPEVGWYWVPRTQWAPAWVSWHRGGGYVGWAPLHPSDAIRSGGIVAVNVGHTAPRAYVFVEERRFLEPVRPTSVVVNNTTIINKTVNITNIKVVNNTVINEGPRTTVIEQVSGKKVQTVPVHEMRRRQEATVVARTGTTSAIENKIPPPVRVDSSAGQARAIPAQPGLTTRQPALPASDTQSVERARVQAGPISAEKRVEANRQERPKSSAVIPEQERRVEQLKGASVKREVKPGARSVEKSAPSSEQNPAQENQRVEPLKGKAGPSVAQGNPELKHKPKPPQAKAGAEHRVKGKPENNKGATNTVEKVRKKDEQAEKDLHEKQ